MIALLEPHVLAAKEWAFRYRAIDKQQPNQIPIGALQREYDF